MRIYSPHHHTHTQTNTGPSTINALSHELLPSLPPSSHEIPRPLSPLHPTHLQQRYQCIGRRRPERPVQNDPPRACHAPPRRGGGGGGAGGGGGGGQPQRARASQRSGGILHSGGGRGGSCLPLLIALHTCMGREAWDSAKRRRPCMARQAGREGGREGGMTQVDAAEGKDGAQQSSDVHNPSKTSQRLALSI